MDVTALDAARLYTLSDLGAVGTTTPGTGPDIAILDPNAGT